MLLNFRQPSNRLQRRKDLPRARAGQGFDQPRGRGLDRGGDGDQQDEGGEDVEGAPGGRRGGVGGVNQLITRFVPNNVK